MFTIPTIEPMKDNRPGTVLIDIDGTLVSMNDVENWDPYSLYQETILGGQTRDPNAINILPGVREKMVRWHAMGIKIVLTTARTESLRGVTEHTLETFGIVYDILIMGLNHGPRYVINDLDPNYPDQPKAIAINVKRNAGLEDVDLQ